MADYSLKDFEGKAFYLEAIKELENNFKDFMKEAKAFAADIKINTTPVTKYCVIEEKEVEFPFPFAEKIKKLFYFIKGKYDAIYEVKLIIKDIKALAKYNLISSNCIQLAPNGLLMNSRVGFMIVVAEKRIKLYEGENLAANELAFLIGVTNQGVVNKIRRGKLEAEKVGVSYQIKNEDAWKLINDRAQSNTNMPVDYSYKKFLSFQGDNSDNYKEKQIEELEKKLAKLKEEKNK
ncbi:MAG: hypothetical protein ACOCV1_06310 [Bacillota bacterium]